MPAEFVLKRSGDIRSWELVTPKGRVIARGNEYESDAAAVHGSVALFDRKSC